MATATLSGAVVMVVASTAWAAPVATQPTPVQTDPAVFEMAPRSLGPSFAWLRSDSARSRDLASYQELSSPGDFYVQSDGRRSVRLNESGTTSVGGTLIPGGAAIYAQQRGTKRPRFLRYDLRTGRRTPLPDAVNLSRHRGKPTRILGDVTASGPWLLYSRFVPGDVGLEEAVLYNRTTRKLRRVGAAWLDYGRAWAGQVNGNWATYSDYFSIGDGGFTTQVSRLNIRTGRYQSFFEPSYTDGIEGPNPVSVWAPAVAADGTWYHWRSTRDPGDSDVEPTNELVRIAPGGGESTVATLIGAVPEDTFVRDRPDGSTQVFYSVDGDIFRLDL